MDAYLELEGCEFYCEDCAPEGAGCYADGGGEADSPQHCAQCHVPLENPLTSEGVRYVLDALEEELANPNRNEAHECYNGTYYEGSPHKRIVLDWAEQLRWYGLSDEEEERLTRAVDALQQ